MNTLEKYDTVELIRELERRKQEELRRKISLPLKGDFDNPIGLWEVTTEGDVEGRSTKTLGTFEGHIVDIALNLRTQCYYSLTFKKTKVNVFSKPPKNAKVSIVLDINSGTWDMDPETRAMSIENFLKKGKANVNYSVLPNNYYASVLIQS